MMEISREDIRLRLLEGLLPHITRLGFTDPQITVDVAKQLESYVVSDYKSVSDEESKSASTRKKRVKSAPKPTPTEDNGLEAALGMKTISPTPGG